MPWQEARRRRNDILDRLANVQHRISDVASMLAGMRSAPPPPAFVCALVVAEGSRGLTTMGESRYLAGLGRETIELRAYEPLCNVLVTVFCDLARVRVSIRAGIELITIGNGPCPVGRVAVLPMGQSIIIDVLGVGEAR